MPPSIFTPIDMRFFPVLIYFYLCKLYLVKTISIAVVDNVPGNVLFCYFFPSLTRLAVLGHFLRQKWNVRSICRGILDRNPYRYTEKLKYPESGQRDIKFEQVFDIAKIQRCVLDRRHPGLSKSEFIFCIYLFGMCGNVLEFSKQYNFAK